MSQAFSPPLSFTLYSSNEELRFTRYEQKSKLYIYTYTVSKTKRGMEVPHNEENLQKLLNIQNIFKPVEFFDTNFEL